VEGGPRSAIQEAASESVMTAWERAESKRCPVCDGTGWWYDDLAETDRTCDYCWVEFDPEEVADIKQDQPESEGTWNTSSS
jgi:uncharacterized protein (DUF983 family)